MLTATPPPPPPSTPGSHASSMTYSAPFLPVRPSPLSPRSDNSLNLLSYPQQSSSIFENVIMTSSPSDAENPFNFQQSQAPSSKSQQGTSYSKKAYKPTPWTARNRDEQRETRRNMFLRRVEADREEKKFGVRSDELMRSDYFAERRRWEDEMVRRATQEAAFLEAEAEIEMEQQSFSNEAHEPNSSSSIHKDSSMSSQAPVDHFMGATVEDIDDSWVFSQDLPSPPMEYSPEKEQRLDPSAPPAHDDASSTISWDDEEYENLFMEFISEEDMLPRHLADVDEETDRDHAMDMSTG